MKNIFFLSLSIVLIAASTTYSNPQKVVIDAQGVLDCFSCWSDLVIYGQPFTNSAAYEAKTFEASPSKTDYTGSTGSIRTNYLNNYTHLFPIILAKKGQQEDLTRQLVIHTATKGNKKANTAPMDSCAGDTYKVILSSWRRPSFLHPTKLELSITQQCISKGKVLKEISGWLPLEVKKLNLDSGQEEL